MCHACLCARDAFVMQVPLLFKITSSANVLISDSETTEEKVLEGHTLDIINYYVTSAARVGA